MSKSKGHSTIMFVGPGPDSQGGIATVIENYSKTPFWSEFGCVNFASTADRDSRLAKLFSDAGRFLAFAYALATSKKPQAVSVHTAHDASFYRKLPYLLICWIFRVPTVLHVHPAGFARFANEGNFFRRSAIKMAGRITDQVIVLSATVQNMLSGVFPPAKISILHNPVDTRLFAETPAPAKTARPSILFLGWIIREKGVYDLVDAMPGVIEEFPEALFTFAGNKEVSQLKELLVTRKLEKSSAVLGWVGGQEKIDLLRSSWVLTLPSYDEGVPNVILEAMASRLPIVTTAVGGLPDILQNGQTALFVEPGNIADIADALKKVLRDSALRNSLASAAYQHVADCYSLEEADRGLRRIYGRHLGTSAAS